MDAPRRPTGRPRKPANDRRAARLPDIRVTASDRLTIESRAGAAGVCVSEFMRRAALGQTVRPRAPSPADRLIAEVNAIGVNLNQITARMHHTGELPDSLPAALDEIRAVLAKVAAYDP